MDNGEEKDIEGEERVAAFEEEENGGLPSEDTDTPEEKPDDKPEDKKDAVTAQLLEQITDLRREIDSRRERDAERDAELAILRSQAAQPQEEEEEEEEEELPEGEKTAILARMRTDPTGAIVQLIRRELGSKLDRVIAKTSRETDGKIALRDRALREQQVDESTALAAFPELAENQELASRARTLHKLIVKEAGRDFGGSFYLAATAAYSEFQKKGKLNGTRRPAPTDTTTTEKLTLREKVRRSALLDEETRPAEKKSFDPREDYSDAELRGIKAACKKYGLTEDQYFKRVASLKKRNPDYGRRPGA